METKKKILVFIPKFPNLTETFIEREIAKIADRGVIDVTVFSLCKGNGIYSESLEGKVYYGRLGIKDLTSFLPYFFRNFSHISRVFKTFCKLKKDVSVKEYSDRSSIVKEIFTFLKSVSYASKFSRFGPDIILAHFLSEPSTIVMHISKILGVPYAISAHAKDITVSAEYTREKVSTASFIAICNRNAYQHVLDQCDGLDLSNIYLAYHGVDAKGLLQKVENKDFRSEKPYILWVGRLVEKKGVKYLVEAVSILKKRGSDIYLNIIGYGPLVSDLGKLIRELKIEGNVKILGDGEGVPNEETLLYFKSAKIYAFPSIETDDGDVDGVANVLLEAGVFKLPVVSTDAGGTGELVIDKETGIVVPQKDSTALADALEILLSDEGLAERLGNNLSKRVIELFDLDTNILWLENMLLRSSENIK